MGLGKDINEVYLKQFLKLFVGEWCHLKLQFATKDLASRLGSNTRTGRNPMLTDLGFNEDHMDDVQKVKEFIRLVKWFCFRLGTLQISSLTGSWTGSLIWS